MKPLLAVSLLSCVFTLSACAHTASAEASPGHAAQPGQALSMQPGDERLLPDRSRLRFVAVSDDSRCKPGLQCIWAGEATVQFQWTGEDGQATALSFNLPAGPEQSAGDWAFELQALDFADPPRATVRFKAK